MAIGVSINNAIPTNHTVVYRPALNNGFSTAGKKSLSDVLVKIGVFLSFTYDIFMLEV